MPENNNLSYNAQYQARGNYIETFCLQCEPGTPYDTHQLGTSQTFLILEFQYSL